MIWTIPGFLGLPTDWHHFSMKECRAIDLSHFPWNSLPIWSSSFNEWVKKQKKEKNILLGYSLGGRLALHCLLEDPSLWHAAIIISAHPGIQDPVQKNGRYQKDVQWAQRFLHEEWISLLSDWNAQSVFQNESFSFYS
jgi:2-succinyl-6-hydroxy-2,4-cyclohexadiene-1-carboxylate synthase